MYDLYYTSTKCISNDSLDLLAAVVRNVFSAIFVYLQNNIYYIPKNRN